MKNINRVVASALCLGLMACAAETSDAPRAAQSAAPSPSAPVAQSPSGISLEKLSALAPALQDEVDAGIRAGFTAAVIHNGEIVYETAVGMADRENNIPMETNTRFRIASMTKPVTTVAIMMLVEEGKVLLSDPVARYIPAFADMQVATSYSADASGALPLEPAKRPITVHHLLTHMAGLGYLFDQSTDLGGRFLENSLYAMDGDLEARINQLAEMPLYENPGEVWRYSYATDVAGRIVEVASGQSLADFMQSRIFTPLGMDDTAFLFDETDLEGTAIVYHFDENGVLQRFEREDLGGNPNTQGAGWYSGGAGLLSTTGDYAQFMMMLLNEGEHNGARILSPATVELMLADHVPFDARPDNWKESGYSFGLGGLVVTEPGHTGTVISGDQWGWGGYYDTYFAVSPEDELGFIVMAQRDPITGDQQSRAQELTRSIAFGALD